MNTPRTSHAPMPVHVEIGLLLKISPRSSMAEEAVFRVNYLLHTLEDFWRTALLEELVPRFKQDLVDARKTTLTASDMASEGDSDTTTRSTSAASASARPAGDGVDVSEEVQVDVPLDVPVKTEDDDN